MSSASVGMRAADPAQLAAAPRPRSLAYVGNQYDRDDAFGTFFAPAAAAVDHVVAGKWTDTRRWPYVRFIGHIPFAQVAEVYGSALATILLVPERGPYDRIVAAVGAFGIPEGWLAQLAPGGRLVVPLRIVGSVSRSIAFERAEGGRWHSVDHQMCGFVPLRDGIADDPRRTIALTADQTVRLHLNQEHDINPELIAGVLDQPRSDAWTNVVFGPRESLEWLFLWLACTQAGRLCRMASQASAVDAGVVDPMFPGSALAVVDHGDLAYLTWRAAEGTADRRERAEVGVIGHGPNGAGLADRVAEAIRLWGSTYRGRSVRFEIPGNRQDRSDPAQGRFFLDRPHRPVTVIWQ